MITYFLLHALISSVVSGFSSEIGAQTIWNDTQTDRLRHDLLLNYDKFSRPTQHYNITTLRLGLSIRHIEFQELKSTMVVYGWLRMKWNDEKLKWNESNYENLSVLRLAEHELWQPDIYLYNSAVSSSINQYGNTYSLVYGNGDVVWIPPVQLPVLCQLNLKHWPFDTQECYMMFGSWTHHGDQINLLNEYNETEIVLKNEDFHHGSEWKIIKAAQYLGKSYYTCCPGDAYPYITVNITLERISDSYRTIIATPAIVIMILTLWTFWLPPQASEKIVLNACTAVIVTIFLLYFTQKLPIMGDEPPQIVLLYSHFMSIVGYSTIESALVIALSKVKQTKPIPWILKKPLTGLFGKLLGLNNYIKQTTQSHNQIVEELRDGTSDNDYTGGDDYSKFNLPSKTILFQHDWILLAAAIDRIFFIVYSIIFIFLYFICDL